jgi:alkylation response protein AidB-like acyl-CoA dehydrogenase
MYGRGVRHSPLIDRRNLSFVLHEVLRVDSLLKLPRYAHHTRETFDAAIELAHELAITHFLPHNRLSDLREPHMTADGSVAIIPEVKAALDAYAAAGFMATIADEELGGMQLPMTIAIACDGMFMAANLATSGYALLARGAADLIRAYGSAEQQARYMRPILDGRYLGTMCLSEPQAGSSLADITTVAEPQADGTYRLRGAKMWISGGDHEMAENIVHMVLAKIPGGPAGVKGISLFIVPRYLVNADGARGRRNDVVLAGVNHKLGQRGIVNTFLKLGESNECVGELVGAPHTGLACMFHMMNAARIGVGAGAVMLGSAGYQYSLQYAQERRQGRLVGHKDPSSPPVAIIEHADVRRMLVQQKAWVEGGLALVLYAGMLVDRGEHELLDLLTPIVKAWPSEWMVKANDLAIQVLGGYGYTREYPVEQYWRDNRLNPIHEGTNGIQAMDLLGRKLLGRGGAGLAKLAQTIQASIAAAEEHASTRPLAGAVARSLAQAARVVTAVGAVAARGEVQRAVAHAHHAITVFGHLVVAWLWLDQAVAAARALNTYTSDAERGFYEGKLVAARWFCDHELPVADHAASVLEAMDPILLELRTEHF